MTERPRLIFEVPNVENTIAVDDFRRSAPEGFEMSHSSDKHILFGGGNNYRLNVFNSNPEVEIELTSGVHHEHSHVSVFVLDSSLILWFNPSNRGLSIPYPTIVFHSVRNEGTQLYLQIESNELLRAHFKEPHDYVPSIELAIELEQLPPVVIHPIMPSPDNDMYALYEAIATCSNSHTVDSGDENDTGNVEDSQFGFLMFSAPVSGEFSMSSAPVFANGGDADDLEASDLCAPDGSDLAAGMDVDVEYASIAGTIRPMAASEETSYRIAKQRRIV